MKIENLGSNEKETVLRFLLHHLEPELRGKLMAYHPVEYVKMAPHTSETVLDKVEAELRLYADF